MNQRIKKKKLKQRIKYPVTILKDSDYSDKLFERIKKEYPEAEITHLTGYGYCICLENRYYSIFIKSLVATYTFVYATELHNLTSENYPQNSKKIMKMAMDLGRLQTINSCINRVGELYAGRD